MTRSSKLSTKANSSEPGWILFQAIAEFLPNDQNILECHCGIFVSIHRWWLSDRKLAVDRNVFMFTICNSFILIGKLLIRLSNSLL